eukprot:gene6805-9320_t
MSFLDIDEILSEEERIPCIVLEEGQGLGYLDSNNNSTIKTKRGITDGNHHIDPDLHESTRIELPLWLSVQMSKKRMIQMELPKHFDRKMRDEIITNNININLKEYSYYFFEVGLQIALETNDNNLKEILRKAISNNRFRSLMFNSLSSWNDDVTEFSQTLTASEAQIFEEGLLTAKDLHRWRMKKSSLLKKAAILNRRPVEEKNQFNSDTTKKVRK